MRDIRLSETVLILRDNELIELRRLCPSNSLEHRIVCAEIMSRVEKGDPARGEYLLSDFWSAFCGD